MTKHAHHTTSTMMKGGASSDATAITPEFTCCPRFRNTAARAPGASTAKIHAPPTKVLKPSPDGSKAKHNAI
jgi:hypothetical protein